jgi:hypothetical protein
MYPNADVNATVPIVFQSKASDPAWTVLYKIAITDDNTATTNPLIKSCEFKLKNGDFIIIVFEV